MVDTTFPVIDKVRRVQAMDGFAHQDYVKLLGNGGPYKHSCVLPPLSILNTASSQLLCLLFEVHVCSGRLKTRVNK